MEGENCQGDPKLLSNEMVVKVGMHETGFSTVPNVDSFLKSNDDFSHTTRSKLTGVLNDPAKSVLVKVELATLVDFGHQFVSTTYNLEGDGPLVFMCYKSISALTAALNIANYPNLNAVSRELSCGNTVTDQQLIAYGKACVNPAIQ